MRLLPIPIRGEMDMKGTWFKIVLLILIAISLGILLTIICKEISITTRDLQSGIIRIWIFGLLISMGLGNVITSIVMKCLRKYAPSTNPGKFTFFLGALEALTYTVSWVQGYPAFIAIWLGIKMAGRWKTEEKKKGAINGFLIGNLLNVIFSFIGGASIKYLLEYRCNLRIAF